MPSNNELKMQALQEWGGAGRSFGAPGLRALPTQEELSEQAWREGSVPGLDPEVWETKWREQVKEPLEDWWEKPRYQKFMDVLYQLTNLAQPSGGPGAEARMFFGGKAQRHEFAQALNEYRNLMRGPDNPFKKGLLKTLGQGVTIAEKPSKQSVKEFEALTKEGREMLGYFTPAREPILPRTTPRGQQEMEHYIRLLQEGSPMSEIYATTPAAVRHELGHGIFRGLPSPTKAEISRAGVRSPHMRATYEPVGEETFAYTMRDVLQRQPGMAPKEMETLIRALGNIKY